MFAAQNSRWAQHLSDVQKHVVTNCRSLSEHHFNLSSDVSTGTQKLRCSFLRPLVSVFNLIYEDS